MHVIDYKGDDLVNAYRGEVLLGDQCIVRENQEAVFFRDGKAYDVLGPGRHTLTTLNIPLLYRAYKAFFDGRTPFTAEVVFVNTSKFTIKFGTKQKIMLKDMVPVGSFGTTFLQIEDPKLFVIEVVGNLSRFSEQEVKNFVESFVIEKFIDTLADYTSFEVYKQTEETSTGIKAQLRSDLDRFGLEIVDLRIEGVTIDESYRNKLFYLQRGVTADQLMGKEVAEKFAEAIRDTKGGGAALGAGFMAIPYALQGATQMMTGPGAALIQCSKCGMQVPRNAKFCPNCGNSMGTVTAGMKCPHCGTNVPAGSKFCQNCGKEIYPKKSKESESK